MINHEFSWSRNPALERLIAFVKSTVETRKSEGRSDIRDPQAFIRELFRIGQLFDDQKARGKKRLAAQEKLARIAEMSMKIGTLLEDLDSFERNDLLNSGDVSNAIHAMNSLSHAISSIYTVRRGDIARQNLARLFVIACIDFNFLPIRVENSVADSNRRSLHCQCLAMLLQQIGEHSNVTNPVERFNLLYVKANSLLRSLRSGFDFVKWSVDLEQDYRRSYLLRATFSGSEIVCRVFDQEELRQRQLVQDEGQDEIQNLPDFR